MHTSLLLLPVIGAVLALPMAASAQTPAAPPAPPARRVAPVVAPAPAAPPAKAHGEWREKPGAFAPEARFELDEARWQLAELSALTFDRDAAMAVAQALTFDRAELAELGTMALDHEKFAVEAAHLADLATERTPLAMQGLHEAPEAKLAAAAMSGPRPGWAPSDPADSLYRIARETLNRSEYRRAAQLFGQMRERYPRSEYVSEAAYWEAFALYRIGTTDDLRAALRVLDQQSTYSRKETQANAAALTARVVGALARRGDSAAQARVAQAARSGDTACDTEDLMVRVEALNALSQLDEAAAAPLLRKVLARHDECSASLRRGAVMLVARQQTPAALSLLGDVATGDPSSSVRSAAISHIGQSKSEEAVTVLERMLRSEDENVRRSAARALARRNDPRARRAIRAYIESPQTGESQKAEAIQNLHREWSASDDVAFLRTMYGRTDSERVRSAIISVLPRLAPEEGKQWLLSIARDPNQPTSSRSIAIASLGRDTSLSVGELSRIYDAANERRIRVQVVTAIGRRGEADATEKLIDIARNGTDPEVRKSAINQLARKKDPRLATLLQELIDR